MLGPFRAACRLLRRRSSKTAADVPEKVILQKPRRLARRSSGVSSSIPRRTTAASCPWARSRACFMPNGTARGSGASGRCAGRATPNFESWMVNGCYRLFPGAQRRGGRKLPRKRREKRLWQKKKKKKEGVKKGLKKKTKMASVRLWRPPLSTSWSPPPSHAGGAAAQAVLSLC